MIISDDGKSGYLYLSGKKKQDTTYVVSLYNEQDKILKLQIVKLLWSQVLKALKGMNRAHVIGHYWSPFQFHKHIMHLFHQCSQFPLHVAPGWARSVSMLKARTQVKVFYKTENTFYSWRWKQIYSLGDDDNMIWWKAWFPTSSISFA